MLVPPVDLGEEEEGVLRKEHEADLTHLEALLRVGRPLWLHGSPSSGTACLARIATASDERRTAEMHAAEVYGAACVWRALEGLPQESKRRGRRLLIWEAHRLATHDGLLALVARISSLAHMSDVSVVLISTQAPPAEALGGAELLSLCIAPYSRAALVRLVARLEHHIATTEGMHTDLFPVFVDLLAGALLSAERDLAHLRSMARLLWPVFLSPLRTGAVCATPGAERNSALVARMSVVLGDYRMRLFQREITCTDRKRLAGKAIKDMSLVTSRDVELPHMAKLLLIAAFLCAHLPRSADSRLFSRLSSDRSGRRAGGGGGSSKMKRSNSSGSTASAAAPAGAHTFRVDRMRAVAVLLKSGDVEAAQNVELGTTIASLVRLGLLRYVTKSVYDEPRLRCIASRQFVEEQCCSVCRINLLDYLPR